VNQEDTKPGRNSRNAFLLRDFVGSMLIQLPFLLPEILVSNSGVEVIVTWAVPSTVFQI